MKACCCCFDEMAVLKFEMVSFTELQELLKLALSSGCDKFLVCIPNWCWTCPGDYKNFHFRSTASGLIFIGISTHIETDSHSAFDLLLHKGINCCCINQRQCFDSGHVALMAIVCAFCQLVC